MKLTIEELADKVNEIISEKLKESPESVKDGRQSNVLSTRRIRDYMTKGLVQKPVGSGREKWFDESHVEDLVALRLMQHNGLSEQYIISNSSYQTSSYESSEETQNDSIVSNADQAMQNNALDFLKSLQATNNSRKTLGSRLNLSGSQGYAANPLGNAKLNVSGSLKYKEDDSELLKSFTQSKYRQFNEYCVEEKLGVFLKVDSKTDPALQRKLLEVLKTEIIKHNKGE